MWPTSSHSETDRKTSPTVSPLSCSDPTFDATLAEIWKKLMYSFFSTVLPTIVDGIGDGQSGHRIDPM